MPNPYLPESLLAQIKLLGHRNWILITDAAYPVQIGPGIETIAVDAEVGQVLSEVLDQTQSSGHIRPIIWRDAESQDLQVKSTDGIRIPEEILCNRGLESKFDLHESLISTIDSAAKTFKVLVLKTNTKLAYSTVFLELQCGYWTQDEESRLRKTLNQK